MSAEGVLHRDDCGSLARRMGGLSCVFAKIVCVNPFEIEDSTGRVALAEAPPGVYDLMDYAYFLIDTSTRPMRCLRLTVAPDELSPVAACQLELARSASASESKI